MGDIVVEELSEGHHQHGEGRRGVLVRARDGRGDLPGRAEPTVGGGGELARVVHLVRVAVGQDPGNGDREEGFSRNLNRVGKE